MGKRENVREHPKYAFWKKWLLRSRDFSFENIRAALGKEKEKKKELVEVGYNLLPLTSAVNQ